MFGSGIAIGFLSPLPACGERSTGEAQRRRSGEGDLFQTFRSEDFRPAPHPNLLPVSTGRGSRLPPWWRLHSAARASREAA
jgi:hypothetical protein